MSRSHLKMTIYLQRVSGALRHGWIEIFPPIQNASSLNISTLHFNGDVGKAPPQWISQSGIRTDTQGGGGGGTDSISLSTNCETTAPLFGQRTVPALLPPNLLPPLFMDNQAQSLENSVKWWVFCIACIIFYQIIVLKGFKNKFECIQLLFDVEY